MNGEHQWETKAREDPIKAFIAEAVIARNCAERNRGYAREGIFDGTLKILMASLKGGEDDGKIPTRTRKFRTDFGTVTETSHDGGKTWNESHREDLPQRPIGRRKSLAISRPTRSATSHQPPELTSCRHRRHGICLQCSNADTVARRDAP